MLGPRIATLPVKVRRSAVRSGVQMTHSHAHFRAHLEYLVLERVAPYLADAKGSGNQKS
jgi:hypothetical protein